MGFQHPEQHEHKMAGIAAAAASPKTPAHLKPHLEAMTHEDWKVLSEDDPDYKVVGEEPKGQKFKKGDAVSLPGGGSGTIQWIGARHDGKDYARVKAENGSKIESVRVDRLQPSVSHKHASTQIDLPSEQAKEVLSANKKLIPDEDLAGHGREHEPHITLKYGVHEDESGLKKALLEHGPFNATLGKVKTFPVSEHSEGTVPVVVEVHAAELKPLRESVHKAISAKEDDFSYKPHVTLAYVKPEMAKKYEGSAALEGMKIPVSSVTLSRKDKTKQAFPLGGSSEIVFARHGATKLDQEGSNETVAGWSDEPLDDRGVKSANEIADKLKDHGLTHIVSSDLHRAKQTADIVAKKLGIEVTTDKRLRPQHVPETEGLKIGQAKPIWNHYESHPDEKPKGGESWREFTKRQDEALKEVEASAKAGQKPMVMTHSRNLEAELGQKPEPGGIVIAKRGTTKQPAKRTPSWAHSRGEK